MKWRDLEKLKPDSGILCLCKSVYGEFDLLEYQLKTRYAFDRPCCWEGNDCDYDYRSGEEWRYWIPVDEIDKEAIK